MRPAHRAGSADAATSRNDNEPQRQEGLRLRTVATAARQPSAHGSGSSGCLPFLTGQQDPRSAGQGLGREHPNGERTVGTADGRATRSHEIHGPPPIGQETAHQCI